MDKWQPISNAYEVIGFQPREHQKIIDQNDARFQVLICHRRFGKTVLSVADLVKQALEAECDNWRGGYWAPTFSQARRVAWDYLLQFSSRVEGHKVNKINHWIDFPNGSRVMLGSADNPDSNRGIYLHAACIDEPSLMPTRLFTECLRPALSDHQGKCRFLGTPMGRHGMLWDVWNYAAEDEEWARFMFKASETHIVPNKELKAARNVMSKPEYDQEWECSFSASIKGAYFGEQMAGIEKAQIRKDVIYNQHRPVHIGLDTGKRQLNAAWFFQVEEDGSTRFLEYDTFPRKSGPDIVAALDKKPYKVYGRVIVPRHLNGGNARADRLRELGLKVLDPDIAPFDDQIEEARAYISNSWFHVDRCKDGIEGLRQYRQDYDGKKETFKQFPVADWSVDPAEAFIHIALVHRQLTKTGGAVDYSLMDRAVCRV